MKFYDREIEMETLQRIEATMHNRITTSIFCIFIAIAAMAQTATPDTIRTHELEEVVV